MLRKSASWASVLIGRFLNPAAASLSSLAFGPYPAGVGAAHASRPNASNGIARSGVNSFMDLPYVLWDRQATLCPGSPTIPPSTDPHPNHEQVKLHCGRPV